MKGEFDDERAPELLPHFDGPAFVFFQTLKINGTRTTASGLCPAKSNIIGEVFKAVMTQNVIREVKVASIDEKELFLPWVGLMLCIPMSRTTLRPFQNSSVLSRENPGRCFVGPLSRSLELCMAEKSPEGIKGMINIRLR